MTHKLSPMLSSTAEYLDAFRDGQYLRFLQWPQFIACHYAKEESTQDADLILNLLVFEWLNNGFCDEDAQRLALLFAVHEMESKPLQGALSYSLTTISMAAFQCMAYKHLDLQSQYVAPKKLTAEEVTHLMTTKLNSMDAAVFRQCLNTKSELFFEWVSEVALQSKEELCVQINSICHLRYCVEDYLEAYQANELFGDPLRETRLSLIKSLGQYLNEQMALTPAVREQISVYVNRIGEMQPASFEKEFLEQLSPTSFVDNSWKYVADFGIRFFKVLQLDSGGAGPAIEGPGP